MSTPDFLENGPASAPAIFLLAHGAGAPMDTDFMNRIAEGVAARGVRVLRFEFPYMAGRRFGGKKRPPDRQPVLLQTWHTVIDQVRMTAVGAPRLFIGGKSMGGRMASLVADEKGADGLICLGYPFHPPGKPEKLRTEHLEMLACPALILQGERDPFGTRDEVKGYKLSDSINMCWLADGNHDLAPRKKSGHTTEENLASAIGYIVDFIGKV